jgi:hypothetical protein
MPQIKLDFLYLVQTYLLLCHDFSPFTACSIAAKAFRVDAKCLDARTGMMFSEQVRQFVEGQIKGEIPSWCVFES